MTPSLMICLPVLAFVLLFLITWKENNSSRVSFLFAATIWAVLATIITEILSLFHAVSSYGLAFLWTLVNIGSLVYLISKRPQLTSAVTSTRERLSRLGDLEIMLLAGAGVIAWGVGLVALVAPPNTSDAMTYHMPRIVHWLQNHSVNFYSTHEFRQLQSPPWAEYAILQLHGLSGSDRFDTLVQWVSLLGGAIGASLVAQSLKAGVSGQVLAAVLSVTIPEGILEASGAKNDYVLAFWLVAAVYFAVCFRNNPVLPNALLLGSALGLAGLTKATAFVLAPPLMAAVLLPPPVRSFSRLAKGLMVIIVVALALNVAHFARNQQLFHSILGPPAQIPPKTFKVTNDAFGVLVTTSNALRNLALHVGTPSASLNQHVEAAVRRFVRVLGQDPNDPRTTWDFTQFQVTGPSLQEEFAGNPLHLSVILVVCGLLLWRCRSPETRPAVFLAAGLVVSFLAFCAVFKWQPWHTRLHLPLFVLSSGIAGAVLERYLPRAAAGVLGMILLLGATPYVFANTSRPLIAAYGPGIFSSPRADLYFRSRGDLLSSYPAAAQFAESQNCDAIGLVMTQNQFEYPLQILLGNMNGSKPVRVVNVTNVSRRYANTGDDAVPCIICPECSRQRNWPALISQFGGLKFFDNVAVLTRRNQAKANSCWAEFSGWYGRETDASGNWWRWSSGTASIQVIASRELDASLEGGLSSIQQPNNVRLTLNGGETTRLAIGSQQGAELPHIPLHLKQGINNLRFASDKPGIRIPSDARLLAISVKNIRITTGEGVGCQLGQ
jgi:hypothetical protein